MKKIVLAGGCFWGVEMYFSRLKGVNATRVGYAQGFKQDPTYKEVCTGDTLHVEVCEVEYDENVLDLNKILEHLFRFIEPTVRNRQGNDIGTQYRTGVYFYNKEDREIILSFIKKEQEKYNEPIVTEVEEVKEFFDAEEYHQKYLKKNPNGYCHVGVHLIQDHELKDEYK
jgi:peptide-methionine (S)-S-oxide reductase